MCERRGSRVPRGTAHSGRSAGYVRTPCAVPGHGLGGAGKSHDRDHVRQHGAAQIAHSCGFGGHASFATAFRREFGMTPGEARRGHGRSLR
ncbi:helix-turn-helix domain-containing protein [Streptomyces sp. NPDC058686]|uniref:helix-turn-helix domain-containing protein n=1 Tax=Streptomyces sp. NPDC058686 TaxID=3346599 RepID=UPI00365E2982